MVVNEASGTATATASLVRQALPLAEVVECAPADLSTAMEKAAGRGQALGVCGGDGTVNLAASVAATHGMPLAVFPGGTLNHFAYDLGIETVQEAAAALTAGDAIQVDLGRFRPGPKGPTGPTATSSTPSAWAPIRSSYGSGSTGRPGSAAGRRGARRPPRTARTAPLEAELQGADARCGWCSSATASSSGSARRPAGATTWRTGCWT
ncbi:hypothetical protein Smic_70180 [Streptomyces microflavus]|uniref:DAGKc domain-containing protein n=1 Tax=Streptomyces microflavus TaxID=1919 RepID=A0A7J0D172_STRMI|nr:hypothetical protein Smic_70180 [Streptomyces microflavus]